MKKLTALLLALAMVLALAACGTPSDNPGGSKGGDDSKGGDNKGGATLNIDMSKYPAKIEDWTSQNFIDYFTEAGAIVDTTLNFEIWTQPHEMYHDNEPIKEGVGWWDDEGTSVVIYTFSPDLPDSSQAQYDEWLNFIRENKTFNEDYGFEPVDHLVGNAVFMYGLSILDDAIYEKTEAACENLLAVLGGSRDF